MKAKGSSLSVDIDLINEEKQENHHQSFDLDDDTYRQDGVTIGYDYLRMDGKTVTRGEFLPGALSSVGQELLGRGAFSVVHRALWKRNETTITVAVKELRLLDGSQQRRKMLLRELKALCKVESPALVHLYGAFLSEDAATMVLEFMDKGSLQQVLQERKMNPLEETMIAPIAHQILVGLAALHENRIIHRDLKPANVLLSSSGAVKLCDFGLATLGEQSLNMTVLGTTKYMAPERLRAHGYGRSSDLWSFGLILLECTTGKPPLAGVTSIVDLLVSLEETNFSEMIPSIATAGLCEMISVSLQVDPGMPMPHAKMILYIEGAT